MNIDLNYAKNNDSISVEETFKLLKEELYFYDKKTLRDNKTPIS